MPKEKKKKITKQKGYVFGKPLKFPDPKDFEKKIDAYFVKCELDDIIPTVTGLAVHLETFRSVLVDYKEKDDYSYSIKKALQKCESAIEFGAMTGKLNPVFSIFNLKNNYGWKDKTEVDQNIKSEEKIIIDIQDETGD